MNDCILVGRDETTLTTFDFMRNEVLQNNLIQFLKDLAESFGNLIFQETRKVEHFRPPNSNILYFHSECGLFNSLFENKWHENPNMENIEFYT